MALIAVIQAGLFFYQLGLMVRATKIAEDAAKSAKDNALATKLQSETIMRAERAYVKMSHKPPGVQVDSSTYYVVMQIKNWGDTPARITETLVKFDIRQKDDPPPSTPDYKTNHPTPSIQAFLVRDEEIFYAPGISITIDDVVPIRSEQKTLWIYGYVDYIDIFGVEHRAGYGRYYSPVFDVQGFETDEEFANRNNMFTMEGSGYNYDRERKNNDL